MTESLHANYEDAEVLRKQGHYEDAGRQFSALWRQRASPAVGWRYIFCLRKLGHLKWAEHIAREVLTQFPDDEWCRSELGWTLYEKRLKPAQQEEDLEKALQSASQILDLAPTGLLLQKTIFLVMKVAKQRGQWDTVLEWADRLAPIQLSTEPGVVGSKRTMADREIWYLRKTTALLKLDRFAEARQQALAGLVDFPHSEYLYRLGALALARGGDSAGAAQELRHLIDRRRVNWFFKADLAELEFELGNSQEAYRLFCEALKNPQEAQYKLGSLVKLARVALMLGKLDVASAHIALARMIREQEGWTIPSDLTSLEQETRNALLQADQIWTVEEGLQTLTRTCERFWQEGARLGQVIMQGTVKAIPEGKSFAFIKRDDGEADIYVKLRELPQHCQRVGARVEFAIEKSFDAVKGRESVRATHVKPIP